MFQVRDKPTPRFIGPFKIMNERGEELTVEFPNFISDLFESRGRDSFQGGRFVTPQNFKI
jgi:hypothetical protein